MLLLTLALPGVGHAQSVPDCAKLPETALLVEHEFCMAKLSASTSASEQAAYRERVWKHTYSVPLGLIKDESLLKRAKEVLGLGSAQRVSVVALGDKRPDWIPADGRAAHEGPKQHAGGGGSSPMDQMVLRCSVGLGVERGHYEISDGTLTSMSWSAFAKATVAEASRDADEFEWDNPSAHGQTPAKTTSAFEAVDEQDALKRLAIWVQHLLDRIDGACQSNQYGTAVYVVGYLLHLTQDLSTHRGITNAEHSLLASEGNNPDAKQLLLSRADRWTKAVVVRLRERVSKSCFDGMKSLQESATIDEQIKQARKSFGPADRTPEALWEYWRLGKTYREKLGTAEPSLHTWFPAGVEANKFLEQHILTPIAKLKNASN